MNRNMNSSEQEMILLQKKALLKKELKGREINLSKETQTALAYLNGHLERIADALETMADNSKFKSRG